MKKTVFDNVVKTQTDRIIQLEKQVQEQGYEIQRLHNIIATNNKRQQDAEEADNQLLAKHLRVLGK
jgi:hypothetical protein